jgi:hypothetical protein
MVASPLDLYKTAVLHAPRSVNGLAHDPFLELMTHLAWNFIWMSWV